MVMVWILGDFEMRSIRPVWVMLLATLFFDKILAFPLDTSSRLDIMGYRAKSSLR